MPLTSVIIIVMKAIIKSRSDFEGRSDYRNRTFSRSFEGDVKFNNNQNFVVPWQMSKMEEKKYSVK